MREIEWSGAKEKLAHPGTSWRYLLLAEDIETDGFCCESYGIAVRDPATGEKASVRHITANGETALALLDRMARMGVSPVALRDVVEDWLGQ